MTGILFYQSKGIEDQIKAEWERARIQTYILVNLELDKNHKITYEKFKRDIWPFGWEKKAIIKPVKIDWAERDRIKRERQNKKWVTTLI